MSEQNTYSDRIHELVAMKLAGELQDDDHQEFGDWLAEDDANEKFFIEQQELWNKSGVELDLDVDAAWANINNRTISPSKVIPIWRLNVVRISAVAASVALIIISYFIYNDGDVRKTIIAENNLMNMELPDRSQIDLRKGASLEYAEDFENDSREVWLKGEAFFNVERDEKRPFIVHASTVDVTVLGTSFFVRESNGNVEVEVVTGNVKVSEQYHGTEDIQLTAEESAVYSKNEQSLTLQEVNPDSQYWLSKTLKFKRTSLKKVARVLSDLMEIEIKFRNEELQRCKLTASFTDNSIEDIAEVIATTFNFKFEISEDSITFDGEGCD